MRSPLTDSTTLANPISGHFRGVPLPNSRGKPETTPPPAAESNYQHTTRSTPAPGGHSLFPWNANHFSSPVFGLSQGGIPTPDTGTDHRSSHSPQPHWSTTEKFNSSKPIPKTPPPGGISGSHRPARNSSPHSGPLRAGTKQFTPPPNTAEHHPPQNNKTPGQRRNSNSNRISSSVSVESVSRWCTPTIPAATAPSTLRLWSSTNAQSPGATPSRAAASR